MPEDGTVWRVPGAAVFLQDPPDGVGVDGTGVM